jgi:hypothetical protein
VAKRPIDTTVLALYTNEILRWIKQHIWHFTIHMLNGLGDGSENGPYIYSLSSKAINLGWNDI